MKVDELNDELSFVRTQIPLFKERADKIENGNWRKNVSEDFDKSKFYDKYKAIIRELDSLLKYQYDAENMRD